MAIGLVSSWAATSPDAGFAAAGRQKVSFLATLFVLVAHHAGARAASATTATAARLFLRPIRSSHDGDGLQADGRLGHLFSCLIGCRQSRL